jgi:Flp pilus assembly protein TadG
MKAFRTTKLSSRAFWREERGAALAEIAIVVPALVLLIFAATEFGFYFYTYTTLDKATRLGARYISSRSFTDDNQAKAVSLMLCGVEAADCGDTPPILPGLAREDFTITPSSAAIFPEFVTVQVNYTYQPTLALGSLAGVSWADVPVSPSTTMRGTLTD